MGLIYIIAINAPRICHFQVKQIGSDMVAKYIPLKFWYVIS